MVLVDLVLFLLRRKTYFCRLYCIDVDLDSSSSNEKKVYKEPPCEYVKCIRFTEILFFATGTDFSLVFTYYPSSSPHPLLL